MVLILGYQVKVCSRWIMICTPLINFKRLLVQNRFIHLYQSYIKIGLPQHAFGPHDSISKHINSGFDQFTNLKVSNLKKLIDSGKQIYLPLHQFGFVLLLQIEG